MNWDYRLVKELFVCIVGDKEVSKYELSIREAYYNKEGKVHSITENPVTVTSTEGMEDVESTLKLMISAASKPVIDLDTFVFAEYN